MINQNNLYRDLVTLSIESEDWQGALYAAMPDTLRRALAWLPDAPRHAVAIRLLRARLCEIEQEADYE